MFEPAANLNELYNHRIVISLMLVFFGTREHLIIDYVL